MRRNKKYFVVFLIFGLLGYHPKVFATLTESVIIQTEVKRVGENLVGKTEHLTEKVFENAEDTVESGDSSEFTQDQDPSDSEQN